MEVNRKNLNALRETLEGKSLEGNVREGWKWKFVTFDNCVMWSLMIFDTNIKAFGTDRVSLCSFQACNYMYCVIKFESPMTHIEIQHVSLVELTTINNTK